MFKIRESPVHRSGSLEAEPAAGMCVRVRVKEGAREAG